jgi:hypothetical protein
MTGASVFTLDTHHSIEAHDFQLKIDTMSMAPMPSASSARG